ncbi:hypothetical protein HNQ93_003409 [Hymenobacter luteus]|uniref:Uncharacterized protein n=2 Tax=Hymenobacter TaxID=89966 RepID=A0A7W9T302_9BACT|nr:MULTISPECIES: hypothetical protein [Hymenobacter]MBB4602644.1 hypothetical protein [Hymenobacter latericoloratus]MBB6060535.1 hypothetical protein [Hymenobacter luteus]
MTISEILLIVANIRLAELYLFRLSHILAKAHVYSVLPLFLPRLLVVLPRLQALAFALVMQTIAKSLL